MKNSQMCPNLHNKFYISILLFHCNEMKLHKNVFVHLVLFAQKNVTALYGYLQKVVPGR